jgi:hypothetical protein
MENEDAVKRYVLQEMLANLPSTIKSALLNDSAILDGLGIKVDATVTLEKDSTSMKCGRNALFDCIRRALLDREKLVSLDIQEGDLAHISIKEIDGVLHAVVAYMGATFELFYAFSLSNLFSERVDGFERMRKKFSLDKDSTQTWLDKLKNRPLTNQECEDMCETLMEVPVVYEGNASRILRQPRITFGLLVPQSAHYFKQLAGSYRSVSSVKQFICEDVAERVQSIFETRGPEGLATVLGMATNSTVVDLITPEHLAGGDLIASYQWILKYGDLISQIGAIELGLRLLPENPDLEPSLRQLSHALISKEDEGRRWNRLANLIVLVDGELSRLKILSSVNPLVRRHSALVHAGLIDRIMRAENIALDGIDSEFLSTHILQFYTQTLIDAREEPYWKADYALPDFLQGEILGRLFMAIATHLDKIKDPDLLVLAAHDEKKLPSYLDGLNPFLPGPLEGAGEFGRPLPVITAEELLHSIENIPVPTAALNTIIKLSDIYRFELLHGQRIAAALSRAAFRLDIADGGQDIEGILRGLAEISAKTRCQELAGSVRILARLQRRDFGSGYRADREAGLCFMAAAAYVDLGEWGRFIGDWLRELCMDDIGGDGARVTKSLLETAGGVEPILWKYCGPAYGALLAVCGTD